MTATFPPARVDQFQAAERITFTPPRPREPLYDTKTIDGFLYLPHTALVVTPFWRLGGNLGEATWRAFGWSLFAWGTWRLTSNAVFENTGKAFLLVTLLVLGPSIQSLAIGQANLHMAALMMLTTVELSKERWWHATGFLMLCLAIKPLIIVSLCLVCVLYRPMWWRTALATGVLLLLPFVAAPPQYVIAQYRDCLTKELLADRPDRIFENISGLLSVLGVAITASAFLVMRIAGAFATLLACAVAKSRQREPFVSFLILAFAGVYLMLFNSRTQPSSYVIVAPVAALWTVVSLREHRRLVPILMFAILLCWCASNRGPRFAKYWLKPFACIAFCAVLVRRLGRSAGPNAPIR